ncbi:MAG: glutaredoxin family protein [Vicinamibacteria bacterium]
MTTVLTLLGKPDCGLCREMRRVVDSVAPAFGVEVIERDVTNDAEAERRYLFEIPVLFLGEEEIARHRITEEHLRERLELAVGRSF